MGGERPPHHPPHSHHRRTLAHRSADNALTSTLDASAPITSRGRRHRKRGRNLTDNDVNTILKIIDGWTGPLMWSLLIEELEKRVHSHYTRQALHRHERILHAFQEKKVSLRNRPENGGDKLVHGSGGISQPRAE